MVTTTGHSTVTAQVLFLHRLRTNESDSEIDITTIKNILLSAWTKSIAHWNRHGSEQLSD